MKDVMAQPSAPSNPSSLKLRVLSAAVMLPVALGAIWLGGWFFAVLAAIATGLMYWEWQGLCGFKARVAVLNALLCGLGPLALLAQDTFVAAYACLLLALLVFFTAKGGQRAFLTLGAVYIFLAGTGLVWLRELNPLGMATVIWLVAVVVMTDTCAYFTGRSLGGPKLAPKISPKKTWSGLIGGIAGAAVAGAILSSVVEANMISVILVSGAFAVVAQIGDLAISKAKRAFDVKDSGNIIPGHGGVLDRFDGILSASLVMALLSLIGGGSPLSWL